MTEVSLAFTIVVGLLPVLAFFLGLRCSRGRKSEPVPRAGPDHKRSNTDTSASTVATDETLTPKEEDEPVAEEEIKTISSKRRYDQLSLKQKKDLNFYRLMIGKQRSYSVTVQRLMKESGFEAEGQFISMANEMRDECATILSGYHQHAGMENIQPSGLERENDFLPAVLRDVEVDILLRMGEALFPDYDQKVRNLAKAVDLIIEKVSKERLFSIAHRVTWERAPEVARAMHDFPVDPHRWMKRGELLHMRKPRRKSSKKNAIVPCKVELVYLRNGDADENSADEFTTASAAQVYVLTCSESRVDSIELKDAQVEEMKGNKCGFIVKGKSPVRKKALQHTFLASNERERDDWMLCLSKFRSKRENVSGHLEMGWTSFRQLLNTFQKPTFAQLEALNEKLVGFSFDGPSETNTIEFRVCFVRCLGIALEEAAEKGWPREVYDEFAGWVLLLIDNGREVVLSDKAPAPKELARAVAIKKGNCAIM